MTVVLDHVASVSVVEATNFGRAFIAAASGCVEFGQWAANPSYVVRPRRIPLIDPNISST